MLQSDKAYGYIRREKQMTNKEILRTYINTQVYGNDDVSARLFLPPPCCCPPALRPESPE